MEKRFVKDGHIFSATKTVSGRVILSYCGKENSFPQGFIWNCYDEAEAMDMVDAIIDPQRYADDEYRVRHIDEIYANCKW